MTRRTQSSADARQAPPGVLAAPAPGALRAVPRRRPSHDEARFGLLLAGPSLLVLGLVSTLPLAFLVAVTFFRIEVTRPWATGFAGLTNYATMLTDPRFWHSLRVTAVYTVTSVALQVVLGLAFALALAGEMRGRHVLRTAVLLPMVLAPVVVGLVWRTLLLTPRYGLLDYLATVLGVAAVVCVSSAVAGELLQDFKVGHILGGSPRSMQLCDLIAVVAASFVLYIPLLVLHEGNIRAGGIGFGDRQLPAPQAGLMASLAEGIVGGEMAWPLVIVGIMMGIAMIMLRVRSPMLVAVGMYLPLSTTFAIFVGGLIRWLADSAGARRKFNEAQRIRAENVGILVASGLIAGEALMGLVVATFRFFEWPLPELVARPSFLAGLVVLALLAFQLIRTPLANAGRPDEPAPPAAIV